MITLQEMHILVLSESVNQVRTILNTNNLEEIEKEMQDKFNFITINDAIMILKVIQKNITKDPIKCLNILNYILFSSSFPFDISQYIWYYISMSNSHKLSIDQQTKVCTLIVLSVANGQQLDFSEICLFLNSIMKVDKLLHIVLSTFKTLVDELYVDCNNFRNLLKYITENYQVMLNNVIFNFPHPDVLLRDVLWALKEVNADIYIETAILYVSLCSITKSDIDIACYHLVKSFSNNNGWNTQLMNRACQLLITKAKLVSIERDVQDLLKEIMQDVLDRQNQNKLL